MKDFVCGEKAKINQEQTFFLCVEDLFGKSMITILSGPVFTKLFRIRIKIRLKLKILLLLFLKPTIII